MMNKKEIGSAAYSRFGRTGIYYTIVDENDDTKSYEEALNTLSEYFIPKANITYGRHLFRQAG